MPGNAVLVSQTKVWLFASHSIVPASHTMMSRSERPSTRHHWSSSARTQGDSLAAGDASRIRNSDASSAEFMSAGKSDVDTMYFSSRNIRIGGARNGFA